MSNKQKLELTWIGKNNPEYDIANIEPRILEERADLSYGDKDTENMIIHGDNLLALKALLPEYEGKVKCIYIDPPYNTGSAFEHYDDNVEHSTWLSLIKPRLELLRTLLRNDGVIFIQIDDQELAYLKVVCDEVFGRENFVNSIVVKMSESSGVKMAHVEKKLPKIKEFLLVYKKTSSFLLNPIRIKKTLDEGLDQYLKYYGKIILNPEEEVEDWRIISVTEYLKNNNLPIDEDSVRDFKIKNAERIVYRTNNKSFEKLNIDKPLTKIISATGLEYIWWEGKQMLFLSDYTEEFLCDLWLDISTINLNKEGGVDFANSKKPELLIQRIISLSSKKNDIILDSFLGSGTTAAVAHKMGRKYIGIEMGEHAYTHCKARLDKVVDGTDQGGISKVVGWKGGGGFKFYELAPSFVAIDEFGNPVIDSYYNDTKLIRAMCKLTNYTFAPSTTDYWKQGKGQGNNNLYVTTQMLSVAMVQQIVSHLGTNETLLICPKKFEPGCKEVDARITIKKIPQSILKACQFGKKEYLLPIKERAMEEVDEEEGDSDDN
jgi:adenine-specific DNA-methyltransferase